MNRNIKSLRIVFVAIPVTVILIALTLLITK